MFDGIENTLQLAFLYGIPALAVAFSFRVIGFPDLTPDGSFVLGAAVGAVLLEKGYSLFWSFAGAMACGALVGIVTGTIHIRLRVSKLLSGILVMTMLYSLSLRIMGTSNISLLKLETFFSQLSSYSALPAIAASVVPAAIVVSLLYFLLKTEFGLLLRATGDNELALTNRGIDPAHQHIIGLALANGLAAVGGFIIAQYQGFVDVSMGTGLVIASLASIVMGETLLQPTSVATLLLAPLVGMVLYQLAIAVALNLGLEPADLKVATAALALGFVALDSLRFSGKRNISRQIGNHNV